MFRFLKLFMTPCLLLAFVCLPIQAQTVNATLSGVVEDAKGDVIPGVKVTITNRATGFESTVVSNGAGYYVIPLLPPATYTVMAEANGFKRVQFPDIVLNVNDQRSLRIQLEVGDVASEVTVRVDGGETVRTDPAVATVIDRDFVSNLPLSGRSFQSLILLTPGVTVTSSGLSDMGQFSVNGQRASTNAFIIDGVSGNFGVGSSVTTTGSANAGFAGAYPGTNALGGTNNLVSVDALEEFKIQTSTYTAEYGRQPGGQVSLVTRSGKNNFQGSLFNYLRNEAFDARNYFNKKPAAQVPIRQNQFGGTFSGPVILPNFGDDGSRLFKGQDRTFFFFSYEGQRLRLPANALVNVPSLRIRNNAAEVLKPVLNAFPRPTSDEIILSCTPGPADPLCTPSSGNPTTGTKPSGFAPFAFAYSNPSSMDATSIRIDHGFDRRHSVFGRFNEAPSFTTTFAGGAMGTSTATSTRTVTVGLISSLSGSVSNEIRANFSRQSGDAVFVPAPYGGAIAVDPALLRGVAGGLGSMSFRFGGTNSAGVSAGELVKNLQRQFNVVDTVTFVTGSHHIRLGFDYRRLSPVYGLQSQQQVNFSSELGVNTATASSVVITRNDSARPIFTNVSLFLQDTWKVSSRLTIDTGARYELNPAPSEAEGKMPAVIIGIDSPPDVSNAQLAPKGTPFYKTFWGAIAPRFGVAYQLRTEQGQETVVRGGIGVYYDLGASGATRGYPLTAVRNLPDPGCTTPIVFPLSPACSAQPEVVIPTTVPVAITLASNAEGLKLPYSLHWNVSIEQSIGGAHVATLSYVASAGRRLLMQQNLNQRANISTGPRPNPNFSQIAFITNGPTSDYHAMQAQFRSRLRFGVQAIVNYTWAHAIDEVSSDLQTNVLEKGNSDFDVRHNFSAAATYGGRYPFENGILKRLFDRWSVDAIVHAQTGQPVNILSGTAIIDGAVYTARPNLILGQPLYIEDVNVPGGRRFNPDAFSSPAPNPAFPNSLSQGSFGRNVLRELPIFQLDVAVGHAVKVSEKVDLKLKAEAFNVLNHPMFGGYGTTPLARTTFGVPARTLNASLGGLSSLYQLGGPRSIQLSARLSF